MDESKSNEEDEKEATQKPWEKVTFADWSFLINILCEQLWANVIKYIIRQNIHLCVLKKVWQA